MSATLFQNIFESSVEGILVVDKTGLIVKANTAAEQIFEYGKGQLEHKFIETLIPEKYRHFHKEYRKNYNKKPKARHSGKLTELWGLKKNGTAFPIDISLSPITADGKNMTITFLRDISERRSAIEALKESERKQKSLISSLPGFVYRTKIDKNYTPEYFSDGIFKITGYRNTAFTSGKVHFGNIIFEKDRPYTWNTLQEAISKKKPFSIEYRIISKSGELKYLFEQGKAIFNNNGKAIALEGFIQDISDRILLQRTVKRKQAKNTALLEALPDTMFILDSEGNYIDFYSSQNSKSILPQSDILGKHITEVLPQDVCDKIQPVIQDTFHYKRHNSVEYDLNINGSTHFFEARLVPLNNNSILSIVRDVTERKNAENTLRIRTRALAAAGNGVLIVDAKQPDYPIVYANDAFTEITGFKQSEVMGKNCRFLQCDDRDQKAIRTMKKAVEEGSSCKVILRNYKKDGSMFYNELTITPVYENQNELSHFIGVQNDVTQRIKENTLKNQMRQVLEMIVQELPLTEVIKKLVEIAETHLNNTLAAVILMDVKTNTIQKLISPNLPLEFKEKLEGVEINAGLCPCAAAAIYKKNVIVEDLTVNNQLRDIGMSAMQNQLKSSWSFPVFSSVKEVLGVFTVYSKVSQKPQKHEKNLIDGIINLLSIAIEQGKVRTELYESRRSLASYAQNLENEVEKRTRELRATLQELVETNLNLNDQIIETKAAEDQARTNEALFSAIAKKFPKGVIGVIDSSNKLIFIGGDELKNFDLTAKDIKNKLIDQIEILNTDQKNFIKEIVRRTLAGKHLSFEVKFKGHTYSVNTTPLFNLNEEINKALLVYNNISENKRVEIEILNALRKEQELNDLKSRFVSMASHEFRTPLSTILSSATLIERQNEPGKEEKRLNYVSRIKSNVRNLVKILNDFLSLSKLEAGNLSIDPQKFDLLPFLNGIIEEVAMNKKGGQTIKVTHGMKKTTISHDPKVIRLIVTNLLSNAIKYSPENSIIEVALNSKNKTVYFQFKDHGIGVPEEDQKSLFTRFFRAHNASHIQGTGLGLYIVKQYVNLIGGAINYSSTEGKGTTFFVKFPVNY
ncbi:MAG: hypothetical protein CSA39_06805 [Flavobacteriales bacterium]|nr:MAG: hypothetical protein CSA39_06805 [Flavobacteriales bacterium]